MAIKNRYEYLSGILEALDVEHTEAEVHNNEVWRSKVLDGMGVEHTYDDINQTDLWRAKVVEGINAMAGGGGSSDFSTATITLQNVGESTTRLSVSMGVCILQNPSLMTGNYIDLMGDPVSGGSTANQKVVLYHGEVNVRFNAEEIVSVNGNIVDIGNGQYKVTGDCSVIAKGSGSI